MLDRSLQAIVANLSTLFLAALLATLPIHFVYAAAMHEVIAASDLHDEIATFPPARQVESVGRTDLATFRTVGYIVGGLEVILFAAYVRVTRRVIAVEEEGEIPEVLDGWSHAFERTKGGSWAPGSAGAVIGGLLLALVIGVLARAVALTIVDPLPDRMLWVGIAVVDACSRALAVPFAAGPLALARREGAPAELML